MNYPATYRRTRWHGLPQVSIRFEPKVFQAIRRAATVQGTSSAGLIRDMVLAWYSNGIPIPHPAATAPAAPIPATKAPYQGTGQAERPAVLQELDDQRDQLRVVGPILSD